MSNASRSEWEASVGVRAMQPAARPQGLRTRDHAAIVYWSDRELLDAVVPYLVEGLRAGDRVVYVADDHSSDLVAGELRAAGVDVDGATSSGQLLIVRAADAFFPNGRFDVDAALKGVHELAAAAARDGFARVRLSVEMTYLLADVPGMENGAEFEARANDEVFAKHPFVCICSFNGNREAKGVLAKVLATHPILLSNGIPLVNPHYKA